METFIIYFLKANLVLSILFPLFWLILKGEKFFSLNRALFLVIILLSLLVPVGPSFQDVSSATGSFNPADYSPVIGFTNAIIAPINGIAGQNVTNLQAHATSTFSARLLSPASMAFFLYIIISAVLLL